VRGSDLVNCLILDPLILPFSRRDADRDVGGRATQGAVAEKGRTVCSAGVEFHVPTWLLTCKVVHSERLTDRSTGLYGTVVIWRAQCRQLASTDGSGFHGNEQAGIGVTSNEKTNEE